MVEIACSWFTDFMAGSFLGVIIVIAFSMAIYGIVQLNRHHG